MHYLITVKGHDGFDQINKVTALPEEMEALKKGDLWANNPIIQIEQIEYVKCLVGGWVGQSY